MKELTETELNDAIEKCKWRVITWGIPICSGNCTPCANEIQQGRCDTLIRLVAERKKKDE